MPTGDFCQREAEVDIRKKVERGRKKQRCRRPLLGSITFPCHDEERSEGMGGGTELVRGETRLRVLTLCGIIIAMPFGDLFTVLCRRFAQFPLYRLPCLPVFLPSTNNMPVLKRADTACLVIVGHMRGKAR